MSESPERVHPQARAEWRAWLAEHHGRGHGVGLVSWRKASGRTGLSYDEAVEEALCFGWVDSTRRTLDVQRTVMWFAPRKRGSGWAASNKRRVARLLAAGLMAPAGLAVVEAAKADGSWALLDDVENLVVPPDLGAALDGLPGAREQWDAFPPGVRRQLLGWIVQARRPETRARRIAETAARAQRGERVNQ